MNLRKGSGLGSSHVDEAKGIEIPFRVLIREIISGNRYHHSRGYSCICTFLSFSDMLSWDKGNSNSVWQGNRAQATGFEVHGSAE
jgi:hypothetical protein